MRPSNRLLNQLRDIRITRNYLEYAEGSVLVEFGKTKVLCTASISDGVPRFLKGKNQGWITAEYGMLPRSTHSRNERESSKGKQSGRSQEIQRLISRSMRAALDLRDINDMTVTLDCDVIQADGGTRTAAITGSCVALVDAINWLVKNERIRKTPALTYIAAVSVGIYRGQAVLDLDYAEDVVAETDMNIVMNEKGEFIEVQGTAENGNFDRDKLNAMLDLGNLGIQELIKIQKNA